MELLLYLYFAFNTFLAGMSVDVHFNSKRENLFSVLVLFFFGGILVLWEMIGHIIDKFPRKNK